MRLWSIHPEYLDTKGLVALWRETLLARSVLENKTKGYKNHPQLTRFKAQKNPVGAVNSYLFEVYQESLRRNFGFNSDKVHKISENFFIPVTSGQIQYEFSHLLKKLEWRDIERFRKLKDLDHIKLHPVFYQIDGEVEPWEKWR